MSGLAIAAALASGTAVALMVARSNAAATGYNGVVHPSSPSTSPLVVDMVAPRGKGIFVRSMYHYGLDPAQTAKMIADYGFRWAALEVIHQEPDGRHVYASRQSWPLFAEQLAARGVQPWIWGWAERGHESSFLDELDQRTNASPHVAGLIVNAEKPYASKSAGPYASTLALGMHEIARPRRLGVGLTTYGGGPPFVPNFPWAEFAATRMIGFPQIYDMQNNLGASYPRNAFAAWERAGFLPVCPIWGASDRRSAAAMAAISSNTPPAQAVSWWDLYWVLQSAQSRTPDRAAFVFNFPRDCSFRFTGQAFS